MTPPPKKSIPAPVAVMIVIVIVWFAAQSSDFFSGGDDLPDPAVDVSETASPEVPKSDPPFTETAYVPEGNDWSTYHGGTSLAGVVDVSIPESPEVVWRYQAASGIPNPPVSDETYIYLSTKKGYIVALDRTGSEQWVRKFLQDPYQDGRERFEYFDAPIALFEGQLLLGSMSGVVYNLTAASGETAWTYELGGAVLGSVNYYSSGSDDGQVYVLDQGEGALHCLALKSGELVWKSEGVERCDGSPSVKNGRVVFGSCAAALHVFDTYDGTLKKNIEYDTDSQVAGGVALVGDSGYSGSYSGRVFRTDLRSGKVLWVNEDSQDEVFTTPAVNADRVIVSSLDGFVYALDKATGEKLWAFDTVGMPTSPVIAQDKVIVSSDGILYILSLDSGEKLWSYEVSDEISAPAIMHGMIVVGSEDGTLTAFGQKTDPVAVVREEDVS